MLPAADVLDPRAAPAAGAVAATPGRWARSKGLSRCGVEGAPFGGACIELHTPSDGARTGTAASVADLSIAATHRRAPFAPPDSAGPSAAAGGEGGANGTSGGMRGKSPMANSIWPNDSPPTRRARTWATCPPTTPASARFASVVDGGTHGAPLRSSASPPPMAPLAQGTEATLFFNRPGLPQDALAPPRLALCRPTPRATPPGAGAGVGAGGRMRAPAHGFGDRRDAGGGFGAHAFRLSAASDDDDDDDAFHPRTPPATAVAMLLHGAAPPTPSAAHAQPATPPSPAGSGWRDGGGGSAGSARRLLHRGSDSSDDDAPMRPESPSLPVRAVLNFSNASAAGRSPARRVSFATAGGGCGAEGGRRSRDGSWSPSMQRRLSLDRCSVSDDADTPASRLGAAAASANGGGGHGAPTPGGPTRRAVRRPPAVPPSAAGARFLAVGGAGAGALPPSPLGAPSPLRASPRDDDDDDDARERGGRPIPCAPAASARGQAEAKRAFRRSSRPSADGRSASDGSDSASDDDDGCGRRGARGGEAGVLADATGARLNRRASPLRPPQIMSMGSLADTKVLFTLAPPRASAARNGGSLGAPRSWSRGDGPPPTPGPPTPATAGGGGAHYGGGWPAGGEGGSSGRPSGGSTPGWAVGGGSSGRLSGASCRSEEPAAAEPAAEPTSRPRSSDVEWGGGDDGSSEPFRFDEQFEYLELLGAGSFSKVYRVLNRADGCEYAVKASKKLFRTRNERRLLLREVEHSQALGECEHIVRYYRAWQDQRSLYLQLELCELGTLRAHAARLCAPAHGGPAQPLAERFVWAFAAQLGAGLAHIHSHGLMHLDIKPENVLVSREGELKIGDLGLCVSQEEWEEEEGDAVYIAPELLQAQPSARCDIFSLGLVLYELAAMVDLPREAPSGSDAWHRLREGQQLPFPTLAVPRSHALKELVLQCCAPEPHKRPSAQQVRATAVEAYQWHARADAAAAAASEASDASHLLAGAAQPAQWMHDGGGGGYGCESEMAGDDSQSSQHSLLRAEFEKLGASGWRLAGAEGGQDALGLGAEQEDTEMISPAGSPLSE